MLHLVHGIAVLEFPIKSFFFFASDELHFRACEKIFFVKFPLRSIPNGGQWIICVISFLQDLYIYVSEQKEFGDFNNSDALIWTKKDLQYGDWSTGENNDGIYTFSTSFPASEVI